MDLIALAPGVGARLLAGSVVEVADSRFGPVRESLAPVLAASLLKQCDEQTLIAIYAIQTTIEKYSLDRSLFQNWGVIAAPDRPGRKRLTDTIAKFRTDGAWSVTPHFIPHCMLHSLPGLVSQAFRLNGPILGVNADDVGLTAAAWFASGDLQRAWLVWTSSCGSGSVTATVGAIETCPDVDQTTGHPDPRTAIRQFTQQFSPGIA